MTHRETPKFGGGLANGAIEPGTTKAGHGLMMVRNIVDAAPDATFYDVPLIPARITNIQGFASHALHVLYQLKLLIEFLRATSIPPWNGPWLLVNAWSIFNRSAEVPLGDYTENPPATRSMLRFKRSRVAQSTSSSPPVTADSSVLTAVKGRRTLGPGTSIFKAQNLPPGCFDSERGPDRCALDRKLIAGRGTTPALTREAGSSVRRVTSETPAMHSPAIQAVDFPAP